MELHDRNSELEPTRAEWNGGTGPVSGATPGGVACDRRCAVAEARAAAAEARAGEAEIRAEQAEARAERFRWLEVCARAELGSSQSQLVRCRARLDESRAENKELRRTAKDALFHKSETARLQNLLSEIGVETGKRSTMASLRLEVGTLRKHKAELEKLVEELKERIDALVSSRSAMAKKQFGRRSEGQERPASPRNRGRQPGAAGCGRTQRSGIGKTSERRDPPRNERTCSECGKPYAANGARSSSVVEIEVRIVEHTVERPRWRRTCGCADSPGEAIASPPARLFRNTPYGNSVWSRFVFERAACHRPIRGIAKWLSENGLRISAGTLAGSLGRPRPLFEPLAQAILEHRNGSPVRHGDETSWRIQALRKIGRSLRAWLWLSLDADSVHYHIDPSRSAEVAKSLFGATAQKLFLVCDRYSAYKKMAKDLDGLATLCRRWSHARRDFFKDASGRSKPKPWRDAWIVRIAALYALNDARLEHYDPDRARQTKADRALGDAVDALFAEAQRQLDELPDRAPNARSLRSLPKHREGLCVFVDHPRIPMDNNRGERTFRGAAIGRKLSFGSDSMGGAAYTATIYSVVDTLKLNDMNVLRWLEDYLGACARNGGRPPEDLSPWLPWSMGEERKRRFLIDPG